MGAGRRGTCAVINGSRGRHGDVTGARYPVCITFAHGSGDTMTELSPLRFVLHCLVAPRKGGVTEWLLCQAGFLRA
ncbi:hypothetical protein [Pseudooceanicola marinus]|nr:hypothetical protein [Pseudooceanicola marinus]PJE26147.1 hypothetical protein CVM50_19935 [Pseudooceanicola marinus]